MDYNEITSYFESLAARHKSIQHSDGNVRFAQKWNNEVQAIFNRVQSPFMVLNTGVGRFVEEEMEFRASRRMGFEIHVPCKKMTDPKSVNEASTLAEKIGKQILAKIVEDSLDYSTCPHDFRSFDASTAVFEHFESMVPNFMTCVFSFDLSEDDYLNYDETQWD